MLRTLVKSFKPRLPTTLRLYTTDSLNNLGKQKTFSNQSLIPRLPIPALDSTLSLYKRSLAPLLEDKELKEAESKINDFENGVGKVLQERLSEYEREQKNSWLEEIWLNKGYLEWREPSLLNVNWWCEFKDHPKGLVEGKDGECSEFQLERSSGLITGLLNFNDKLNREEIEPEYVKDSPLCMNQYHHQIGTSRIAGIGKDSITSSYPCLAHHIILSYKNQLLNVPVLTKSGHRVTNQQLIDQLKKAVSLVDSLPKEKLQLPVGILTGEHRDIWASARNKLEQNKENKQNLDKIDCSLSVLCLEPNSPSKDFDISHHTIFHGHTGLNRWFDKAIQFIVNNNGRAGINGEHTPADAVIPGRIINDILASEPVPDPTNLTNDEQLDEPTHLKWEVDSETKSVIESAQTRVPEFISNIKSILFHFNGYGSNEIKKAKISPDAFVQMALQLAYYRTHQAVPPTYETASTRAFLHGRTETVRSCSIESKAFVQAFDNPQVDLEKKLQLFNEATLSHLSYMKKASRGLGVDRHLLGLRCMVQPDETMPSIFQHPSYLNSMSFKLSTSNMSPGKYFYGGFAPVVKDGYGVNYAIGKDQIKLSISKWAQSNETDHFKFKKEIENSFKDLAKVLKKKFLLMN